MELTEALAATATPTTRPCYVATRIDRLEEPQRADVLAALADPHITHANLTRALNLMGVKVLADALGKHRRKACPCGA